MIVCFETGFQVGQSSLEPFTLVKDNLELFLSDSASKVWGLQTCTITPGQQVFETWFFRSHLERYYNTKFKGKYDLLDSLSLLAIVSVKQEVMDLNVYAQRRNGLLQGRSRQFSKASISYN